MKIIEIIALENGAHRNNESGSIKTVPDGWAVIPEDMECENFPFGEVEAEEVGGVMTVTKWTAGEMPEVPTPEEEPTVGERVDALEEALDMILNGVTE